MSWSIGINIENGIPEIVSKTDFVPDGRFTITGHDAPEWSTVSTSVYLTKKVEVEA